MLSAGGLDDCCQLGIKPTTKNNDNEDCVDVLTRVPFDFEGAQCVSGGYNHSVIIKDFRVFAAGNDKDFRIGSDNRVIYETFTEVKISEEPISWAACGYYFTLYLTLSGRVILCQEKANFTRISIPLAKKAVSIFAGHSNAGIIDESGEIYCYIVKNGTFKNIQRTSLKSPPVQLVCCQRFFCALTVDGRVFGNFILNNRSLEFIEIPSLRGQRIIKISGLYETCAALSSDGRLFTLGANDHGQLVDGTTIENFSSFAEVRIKETIKDVSCSWHTLILTESNKIYGCGFNSNYELFKSSGEVSVIIPARIATMEADQVIACYGMTFVISKNSSIRSIEAGGGRINVLLAKIEEQSRCINQLMDICGQLQQQNEANKREQSNQAQKIEELSSKLDRAIKYINDQDYF